MTGVEWKADDVLVALERRGYQRLAPCEALGKALRYESPFSSAEAGQYLHLHYKPVARAYEISIGWSNATAREALERCLMAIQPLSDWPMPAVKSPYWVWFNACRIFPEYPVIPSPLNRREGPRQWATLVESLLEPVVETTRSAADIAERLLRNDLPFEWMTTNPVSRAAEVMATTLVAGQDIAAVMPQLLQKAPKQGNLAQQWPEALEKLASIIRAQMA